MREYETTYKRSYNFMKWCQYWENNGFKFRHTAWKRFYPSFVAIERSSDELVKAQKHPFIHAGKEYTAVDEKGYTTFFDRNYLNGEWYAVRKKSVDDLFE